MKDLNQEYNRILNLIGENKTKFDSIAVDDDFIWSLIEVETFLEIIKFGIAEGLNLSNDYIDMLFNNDEFNETREFEISTYEGMILVKEELEKKNGIPPLMNNLMKEMNDNFYS
jgi:hypothetical protein